MTKDEFLTELAEVLDLPEGHLNGKEVLEELPEWDSLAVMSFIAFVDEKFKYIISGDKLVKAKTIDDLFDLTKMNAVPQQTQF